MRRDTPGPARGFPGGSASRPAARIAWRSCQGGGRGQPARARRRARADRWERRAWRAPRPREERGDYLRGAVGRGELAIDDFDLAADQFAELCKADLWPRLVFGIDRHFSEAEVTRVIDGAVETFMARYGCGDFSYEKSRAGVDRG